MKNLLLILALIILISCDRKGDIQVSNREIIEFENVLQYHKLSSITDDIREQNSSDSLRLFFSAADSAIYKIEEIQNELILSAGGYIKPAGFNWFILDKTDKNIVERYFYRENHVRDYAIDYLEKTIDDFDPTKLDSIGTIKITIHLNYIYQKLSEDDAFKDQKTEFNEFDIFKDLTVNEALDRLNSYKVSIEIEKLKYALKK